MRSPIDKLVEAEKTLPLGHIGIKQARNNVKQEYQACREHEKALFKQWLPKKKQRKNVEYVSWTQAEWIAKDVCHILGIRQVQLIRESMPGAAGFYRSPKTIAFCCIYDQRIALMDLVHELAHHVVYCEGMKRRPSPHGENFMWCEFIIVEALKEMNVYEKLINKV